MVHARSSSVPVALGHDGLQPADGAAQSVLVCTARPIGLVRQVRLQMSTSRLLRCGQCTADGQSVVVVLHLQVSGVHRYVLLRFAQEVGSHIDVARHPPRSHAHERVVGRQVHSRSVVQLEQWVFSMVLFLTGGHSTFFAFINSFVHIIMYIYYGLAAIGPCMNRYLWWKKYMTAIQMVSTLLSNRIGRGDDFVWFQIQFILIFMHSFQLLFRECDYPRGFMWWIGFHAVLFWFLFYDFYKNAYKMKQCSNKSNKTDNAQSCRPENSNHPRINNKTKKKVAFSASELYDNGSDHCHNGRSLSKSYRSTSNDISQSLLANKTKRSNENGSSKRSVF